MNNLKRILLFLAVVSFLGSCSNNSKSQVSPTKTFIPATIPSQYVNVTPSPSRNTSTVLASGGCIKPFPEFAYSGPNLNQGADAKIIAPSQPWQIETTLPFHESEGYFVSSIDTEATRSVNGHQEIWLIEHLFPTESRKREKNLFLIYYPESQEWKFISADIGTTGLFVQDLFVTSDGSIWGKIVWNSINPSLKEVPVLSKFDDDKQRFEFLNGVLKIPWAENNAPYFPWPEIIVDSRDIFWFFVQNDGLYRYDPVSQRTEKQASLPNLGITQATLSLDGSIYFEIYNEKVYSEESFFRIVDGMLFQFIPDTKEIITLKIPTEPWPIFSGMLVDSNARLWLGAIGYREQNGTWHLIHPNPKQYLAASAGDIYMAPPSLMLESSDGVLWYQKPLDDIRASGTAWYDPQTGDGCMFTNLATNIVEDSLRQLWLVGNGKLYKYVLKKGLP